MKIKLNLFLIFCLCLTQSVAQNSSVISFDSFEITNPSYVGLYDVSHISVDTKQSFDLFDKSSNNSSLYGAIYFENLNFFIAYSASTYNFSEVGISQNNLSLSYVYRLQLSETNYLYPNVSVNYYSPGQLSNLLFEDQILFGGISSDILASNYNQKQYFDVNAGLMFRSMSLIGALSINNLLKAKITDDVESQAKKLKRTIDLNLGYQRELIRNTMGIAIIGSYYYRPSMTNQFNFSEFRLDQIFSFDIGLEVGVFQEFFSNSFSSDMKSIGANAKIKFPRFNVGVNYKASQSKEIQNLDNYLGVFLRFNFKESTLENLFKW
jgi:hypothetical protein